MAATAPPGSPSNDCDREPEDHECCPANDEHPVQRPVLLFGMVYDFQKPVSNTGRFVRWYSCWRGTIQPQKCKTRRLMRGRGNLAA